MTNAQAARTAADWSKIAGETVRVEEIGGAIYGFCGELGALRLFHKFQNPTKCRAAFSQNMGTWYFSVEMAI